MFTEIGRYRAFCPLRGFYRLNSDPFAPSTRAGASCLIHKLILEVFGDCVAILFLHFLDRSSLLMFRFRRGD